MQNVKHVDTRYTLGTSERRNFIYLQSYRNRGAREYTTEYTSNISRMVVGNVLICFLSPWYPTRGQAAKSQEQLPMMA